MNEKQKKSINCEKVRFQFWSEEVERKSGITQVCQERVPHNRRGVIEPSWTQCLFWFMGHTFVGPTSRMSACWHDWRKLKPECTDRIGNWELDHGNLCRQGGRSHSSPGPPHPTSATVDAWLPTQMIGTVVAVSAWWTRRELPVVCKSDNADRKRVARYSSWYACVWARIPEHELRPQWWIDGWLVVVGVEKSP